MTRVVVVGAGISGLAAAHALRIATDAAGEPVEVMLIEAASEIGGRLAVSEVGGVAVDAGAEAFLARAPEGRELIEACGLAEDLVAPATTSAGVWARGIVRPLPARTVLGVPSSVGSLRGLISPTGIARAAADLIRPGAPPGDEDVAVGGWLRRRLGDDVVDLLVDPLLGGVYAGHADELSLQATMPMLDRTHRSAIAAARASLPPPAPRSTFEAFKQGFDASNVHTAVSPAFGTLRGGLGSLPAAVLAASGATLLSGRTVRRIERLPRGWRVIHGATNDEQVIEAAAVIIAVPAVAAARLLRDIAPTAAADLGGIDAASLAIVTTAWRRGSAGPLTGSGYLVPAVSRPRRAVKAVTLSSNKWAHLDAGELVIARCSFGRHGETSDLQRDDSELARMAAEELRDHAGFAGEPVDVRVTRWGGGLPQPAVGHRARVARIRSAVAKLPGLAVCGAAYDGVGVPACIRTGRQAAAQVAAALSKA